MRCVVGLLATLGVLLSAAVTAARNALLRSLGMDGRARLRRTHCRYRPGFRHRHLSRSGSPRPPVLLIEAESLLNDGTASVAFAIVVALATGQHITTASALYSMCKMIGGGVACGAAVGIVSLLLTGRTQDHLIELTFTTVAAYGSFLLADSFGMSGVLATITAGLVMRNFEHLDGISPRGKEAISNFWQYAAFIANSMVFLLIGTQQRNQNFLAIWAPTLIAIGVVLAARAVAVYSCGALFNWSSLRVSAKHQMAHGVGRPARRSRPGAGAGPAPGSSPARRDCHGELWRGRLLDLCAGHHHETIPAQNRRVPAEIRLPRPPPGSRGGCRLTTRDRDCALIQARQRPHAPQLCQPLTKVFANIPKPFPARSSCRSYPPNRYAEKQRRGQCAALPAERRSSKPSSSRGSQRDAQIINNCFILRHLNGTQFLRLLFSTTYAGPKT